MDKRVTSGFLVLVMVQAFHSAEEYMGRLWEVFPPAIYFTSLFSDDLEVGFLRANIGLFIFGILCWLFPIRRNYAIASGLLWFWICLEIINGLVHSAWSIYQQSYTPGLITAPFLIITAIYLVRSLRASKQS